MSSRFSEFLTAEQIDPRRLLVASRQLERLRPEDRAIKLKKRLGKKNGDAAAAPKEGEAKEAAPKRRSGRNITPACCRPPRPAAPSPAARRPACCAP